MVNVPATLTPEYLAERWSRLYHMAEAGSWESVKRHGLLSTRALLDLFGISGAQRDAIEAARRPRSVPIHHPEHGTAWIRDNKPINETVLRRTLTGMSEPDWYRTLNGRVFFWLSERRLEKLRNAPAYQQREHDILTIDTNALLDAYADEIELCHLNSGAVHPAADYPRGAGTFQPIATYLWLDRLATAPAEPIVELTIPYAVPDIERFVIDVTTR
ncbi:MAG TPA: hypothetical protein VG294_06520 [Solirubrobacteraceae bacterium]|nr:hypothetical protein [Solirubrobacteraceae bacterium]